MKNPVSTRWPLLFLVPALLLTGCWQKPASTKYITDSQGRALILDGFALEFPGGSPWWLAYLEFRC